MWTVTRLLLGVVVVMFTLVLAGCESERDNTSEVESEGPKSSYMVENKSLTEPSTSTAEKREDQARFAAASTVPKKKGLPSARSRTATDPDEDMIGWIYYDWSGVSPQLDTIAEKNVSRPGQKFRGQQVDEFNRQELVKTEHARLVSMFNSAKGFGYIVANIAGNLGDYDSGYGEFHIGPFSPGSTILFSAFDRSSYLGGTGLDRFHLQVKLVNALDAYIWEASPDDARSVVSILENEGSRRYRKVYARANMKILSAAPGAGEIREMEAEIQSFSLFTEKGTLLMERNLQMN